MKHFPKIIPWLTRSSPVRVAIIGDIILDEYLDGEVNRISPEAPVPVHKVKNAYHSAGGAANVARNVKLAGGEPFLFSVCGNDEAANFLKDILLNDGIDITNILVTSNRPTVKKTRISANNQQLARIDWEKTNPIEEKEQNELLHKLVNKDFDVLVVSDYGKGCLPTSFLRKALEYAESKKIITIVDPKGKDFSKYAGAHLITPNRKEAAEALGIYLEDAESAEDLGRRLQKKFNLKNVLLTLGSKGLILINEGGEKSIYLPAETREVFDVSGAGDTVVAAMALALGAKAGFFDSIFLANLSAGVVVGKWGTQPITSEELDKALREKISSTEGTFNTETKIVSREFLKNAFSKKTRRKKKIVFTNGCFDILHAGHVTYLEKARSLGDWLVVGINDDASIRRLKGPDRPYVTLPHRMRILAALSCIDYVVPFSEDTPANLIADLIPDVLVKGADWQKENIVGADLVLNAGGKVETIALVEGLSTSDLVKTVRKTSK